MRIAVLGTGNVGKRLGLLMYQQGHEVRYGSRDPSGRSGDLLHDDAQVAGYVEAIRNAEVVFVATPWAENVTLNILASLESTESQIYIDCTNPLAPDYMSNLIGHTTSAGEQVVEAVLPAKTVKAFNTIFANVMVLGQQQFGGVKGTEFYCGDEKAAKEVVRQLIDQAGFDPVDAGPMRNARYLEATAQLNIQIAFGMGGGTDAAFRYWT